MIDNEIKAGIIDYNVGNVNSVQNAIHRIGYDCIISNQQDELKDCSHYILPGVGAFDEAKRQLDQSGLIPFLQDVVFEEKKPVLGICVGMQLLLSSSEENGIHEGLNWIQGEVVALEVEEPFKVPHVGWNDVQFTDNPLFENLEQGTNFYFDHSFECKIHEDAVIGITNYCRIVHASVCKENLYAVQFHPEKSQIAGLRLFKNFLERC